MSVSSEAPAKSELQSVDIPSIGDPAQLIALAGEITSQAAGRCRLAAERS